jgi:hypothetical protein
MSKKLTSASEIMASFKAGLQKVFKLETSSSDAPQEKVQADQNNNEASPTVDNNVYDDEYIDLEFEEDLDREQTCDTCCFHRQDGLCLLNRPKGKMKCGTFEGVSCNLAQEVVLMNDRLVYSKPVEETND